MRRAITRRSELLDHLIFLCHYTGDRLGLDQVEQDEFLDYLQDARDGIETQLNQSNIEIQQNWFRNALSQMDAVLAAFRDEDYGEASRMMWEAEETFRSGISAHTRSTDFIASPSGTIHVVPSGDEEPRKTNTEQEGGHQPPTRPEST
jgi:hypothetical protein